METAETQQKEALLREMLTVTEELVQLLEQPGDITDELIDKVVSAIEVRGVLISQIDALPQGRSAASYDLLLRLKEDQEKINRLLLEKKARLQQNLRKVRSSKRSLKGYYNSHVARTPSFVDTKR
ncbi:MAG: hypothetical protein H0Z38_08850 [Firmicutes bacterium]|nr:hypothetical protein [Bacillota bacterium]